MRRAATIIATALVVASAAAVSPAPAQTGGAGCPQPSSSTSPPPPGQLGHPLTEVALENCQSGTQQLGSRVQVVHAGGQDAQPTNLAWAYSHDCASGCTTIAVAYQVALVRQDSPTQQPQNAAVAINQNCDSCRTFAYADQYAVDVPNGTNLTGATRREIDSIRQQAQQDVQANLPLTELDARLHDLAGQLHQDVLDGLAQEHVKQPPHHDVQHTQSSGQ